MTPFLVMPILLGCNWNLHSPDMLSKFSALGIVTIDEAACICHRPAHLHLSTMSHICPAAWPLRTADGELMWNRPLSPFYIPDGGLEYPSDEEERQRGFDGKTQDILAPFVNTMQATR